MFKLRQITEQIQPFQDVPLGLPKIVDSLCPDCKQIIKAKIFEKNNKVWMEKVCQKHGKIIDLIYSDAKLYLKMEKWGFEDFSGTKNPQVTNAINCPYDCGLCNLHYSVPCLTNIDLTNRCNLRCPICFANANVQGYVYELTLDQIKNCLETIKNINPLDTYVVQFSGGEPTIHPNFLDAVRLAKDMGFAQIQIATNGITFTNLEFVKKCKEAGLSALYLQFDGVTNDSYKKTRGVNNLFNLKKKVIENCRKVKINVILVPTIVNTINNNQVGPILDFAIDNIDVVRGISYQPVAFTGRISTKERLKQRFTLSDLAYSIEKQTGYAKAMQDFYPLAISSPMSKVLSKIWNKTTIHMTSHTNCGIGTYLLVNTKTRQVYSLTKFMDFENLMLELNQLSKEDIKNLASKYLFILKVLYAFKKNFIKEKAPPDLNFVTLMKVIAQHVALRLKEKNKKLNWNLIFAAGMHFQDNYDYNIDRVKRCVILYSAPNGKLYPFCSYNSGPVFREYIEKKYSTPLDEWIKKKGSEYVKSGFYS